MSDAKKCDRCGAFYTDVTTGLSKCRDDEFTFNYIKLIYSTTRGKSIDLCQRCIDELCKWLNKDEEKRLTCYELASIEHPENINPNSEGKYVWCDGCPTAYGYIYSTDKFCRGIVPSNELCTKCWNQVATRYYDEKENADDKA